MLLVLFCCCCCCCFFLRPSRSISATTFSMLCSVIFCRISNGALSLRLDDVVEVVVWLSLLGCTCCFWNAAWFLCTIEACELKYHSIYAWWWWYFYLCNRKIESLQVVALPLTWLSLLHLLLDHSDDYVQSKSDSYHIADAKIQRHHRLHHLTILPPFHQSGAPKDLARQVVNDAWVSWNCRNRHSRFVDLPW